MLKIYVYARADWKKLDWIDSYDDEDNRSCRWEGTSDLINSQIFSSIYFFLTFPICLPVISYFIRLYQSVIHLFVASLILFGPFFVSRFSVSINVT
jgi:hypothetical protein